MRTEPNPHKRMTLPSTQNLKALGLWVFFLICCSNFSFLLNVGLRLTLGYLTNLEYVNFVVSLQGNSFVVLGIIKHIVDDDYLHMQ